MPPNGTILISSFLWYLPRHSFFFLSFPKHLLAFSWIIYFYFASTVFIDPRPFFLALFVSIIVHMVSTSFYEIKESESEELEAPDHCPFPLYTIRSLVVVLSLFFLIVECTTCLPFLESRMLAFPV